MIKNKQKKKKKDLKEKKETKSLETHNEENEKKELNIFKNLTIITIILIIIIMTYFQYKYEYNENIGYDNNEEENYYSILGLEQGANLKEIRKSYKKLSKIYHPDKNPNCTYCKEKFLKITKAHEILIKNNENTYTTKNLFSSNPIILTYNNYHKLIDKSNDFWIILVYEKKINNDYLNDVISIFDEVSFRYKSIIKFGVIDILKENKLRNFLPFSFNDPPSIYSHLNGIGNEIYNNIENINYLSLLSFIQNSYQSNIILLDKNQLSKFYSLKGNIIHKNNINIKKDLDLKFFIFSSKNVIDLIAKDFQKNNDNCQIYQNEFEIYKEALEIFNVKNNEKVFISFNNITDDNNLIKEIFPIPIQIGIKDDMTQKLQKVFEIGKKISFLKIYKNNFFKHCSSKIELIDSQLNIDDDEIEEFSENNELNDDHKKIIDICVIELEDFEDIKFNKINIAFYKSFIYNFRKNLQLENINDDAIINVNYGYVNLKDNKKLFNFYNLFLNTTNTKFNINGKKYLIIDLTKEKFLFKSFIDSNSVQTFFMQISNIDFYEDLSMAFSNFNDYKIKDISNLFNISKIFSIQQILLMCLYCQMKISYVTIYILIFFSTIFLLKYNGNKALSFMIYSFIFNFISHFIFFLYEHYKSNE